jgi:methyl-accepting chemotaxis protein
MKIFDVLMRRFSIRLRMNAAIAVVLGMFASIATVGLLGGAHLGHLNTEFMTHSFKEVSTVAALRHVAGTVRLHEKNMVIDYEDGVAVLKHREAWAAAMKELQARLAALLEGEEDEDNVHARAAMESLKAYAEATGKVLEQIQNGAYDNARAADRMLARAKEHIHKTEAAIDKIAAIVDNEAVETQKDFEGSMRNTLILFAAVMAAAIVVLVPLTLANSRSIVAPINSARQAALAIADGRLDETIRAEGRDETAELLRALHTMQQSLVNTVGTVRDASLSINNASAEVASGNADLSMRTEQAASQLQQTSSSMSQLTGTVRQSADAAQQANQLAATAAAVAERGGSVVGEVITTMDRINTSSRKIADIIATIDGIAFQTNILALNAAVEAARAGEAGRGFAVVAGEVRSLAGRSAEAAREIKSLIGASVENVESGSRLVADAGQTMTEIVESVRRVSSIIGEISVTANEQSGGIAQVNQAVGQLDQVTQQNAALVEQSAAAAESLKEQASRLAEAVSAFRLSAAAA